MASELTLYDAGGNPVTVDGDALKGGLATAWVNFDGATGNVNSSYNIASVTRTGLGIYDIVFSSMDNDTWLMVQGLMRGAFNATYAYVADGTKLALTATINIRGTGGLVDPSEVYLTFFGGKA